MIGQEHGNAEGGTNGIDPHEIDKLLPAVYNDLRRLAGAAMRDERDGHTLQPTALAHEAYLRLAAQHGYAWQSRRQLLAVAGRVMRRVLVDHARARAAAKRGGDAVRLTVSGLVLSSTPDIDLLALDEALTRLAAVDARAVRIVELRHLAGLTLDEVAQTLAISKATVKRDWSAARAWLIRELEVHDRG